MTTGIVIALVLYTIACFILIGVILIQSGDKGGGLSSLGSSSQGLSDALGATGAEKTLNKMTTIAACTFMILAIVLSIMITMHARNSASGSLDSVLPSASQAATDNALQSIPAGTLPAEGDTTSGSPAATNPASQPPAAAGSPAAGSPAAGEAAPPAEVPPATQGQ